uniref:Uncharacterized protein n=1 Tax=Solanum tuberosum TaxID=4113 RepID=M1DPP9_SOLTU
MTTRRDFITRVEEDNVNEGSPTQVSQVSQYPQATIDPSAMSNVEVRWAFQMLTEALAAQANRDVVTHVNPNVNSIYAAADHLAKSLVGIIEQLGDSPFGVVHRRLAPTFYIVVLWVTGRNGTASRNFLAMCRVLPFFADLILSFSVE